MLAAIAVLVALFAVLLTGNPWPDRFLITLRFDPVFLRMGGLDLGWHGVFTALAVAIAVSRQESTILWGLQEAQLVALATGAISLLLFVARRLRGSS